MKTLSKIIAYALCLQLTVGSYPLINSTAYAQDYNTTNTEEESGGGGRGPASDNLAMPADEWYNAFKTEVDILKKHCMDSKGNITPNVAVMPASEIGGEGKINNCGDLAEKIKADLPVANEIFEEAKNSKNPAFCADCAITPQMVNNQTVEDIENSCQDPVVSISDQKKFSEEKCNFGCDVLATFNKGVFGCPASSGISGACMSNLVKGIGKGIYDATIGMVEMLWDGIKWGAKGIKNLFTKTENASTEKALGLAGLTDAQLKNIYASGKADPKKVEAAWYENLLEGLKGLSDQILGFSEYQEKAKCTNCKGKNDIICGIVSERIGFLIPLIWGNKILGFSYGAGAKAAKAILKFSKGTSKGAKFVSGIIKSSKDAKKLAGGSLSSTGAGIKTGAKWVAKPFIPAGNLLVKGASKLSPGSSKWWATFKEGKLYGSLSGFNKKIYKNVFHEKSIPGKITLSIGHNVKSGFDKMNAYQTRRFIKGVGVINKPLARAMNINKIRAAKLAASGADLKNTKTSANVVDDAEKTSVETEKALQGVDELKVVKDASEARPMQDWDDLKKAASNKLSGVKVKHLDGIENVEPVTFSPKIKNGNKMDDVLVAETSKGAKDIKGVKAEEVKSISEYQDAKFALIEKNDGSYIIHDMDEGKHLTQAKKGSQEIDALMGKGTEKYGADLDSMSYEQVKTNLKLNETKFVEEVDAASGAKTLKIETPNGCNPKTLSFGVSKGI